MNANKAIVAGAVSMAVAVGLGAFGAHGLKDQLLQSDTLEIWHTDVRYEAWHALALVLLGQLTLVPERRNQGRVVGWLLLLGSLLFSGSLFALALAPSATWLGPVTPLGGALLIASWLGFARLGLTLSNPGAR